MRIIKEGDLNRLKRTVRFDCGDCGCVFEADKDEYKISDYGMCDPLFEMTCPCCGCVVISGNMI